MLCAAGTAYFSGEFDQAAQGAFSAETYMKEHCTGVSWELTNVHIFGTWSLAHMGQVEPLKAEVDRVIDEALAVGDQLALTSLRCGLPSCIIALSEDEPDRLRETVSKALDGWPGDRFQTPHYYALVSRVIADHFDERYEAAWERLEEAWSALGRSGLLRFQLTRCELTYQRGRSAAAAAIQTSSTHGRSKAMQIAHHAAKHLSREDFAPAIGWAQSLQAQLAIIGGRTDDALAALELAETHYERCAMALYAHAARAQTGALQGSGAFENWNVARALTFPVSV
jgi:hypothetical protein